MLNPSGIAVVAAENRPDEREPNLQSQAGRSGGFAAAPSRRKPRFTEGSKQVSSHLVQPSPEDWKDQKPEVIAQYYAQTKEDFFGIVEDYFNQAELAVELYKLSSRSHRQWRFWTIIATGMLAAINVCAALELLKIPLWGGTSLPTILSGVAALYAAGLTVAGNVENFFNKGEQAAGFREARELLLSRHREYSSKWLYYVDARQNANRLHERWAALPSACRLRSGAAAADQTIN